QKFTKLSARSVSWPKNARSPSADTCSCRTTCTSSYHCPRQVSRKQLLKLGFDKPHWQEGFFDHLLRTDESYSQKWDYVQMNPVRAGLGPIAKIWPYQGEILNLRFD